MSVDPADRSDSSLVIALAGGDEAALAEVYRRYAGQVYSLARRVLRSTEPAEEVMQEVFARLWRQPDRFDPDRGALRSFLLCEAHGRAVDLYRSDSARRRREERAQGGAGGGAVDVHGSDIEREVWDHVQAEKVREVLDDLPVAEREAILLAYFGGHTYREVARLTDQPEGTVKSRIRSGLRRLADALDHAGYGARHDTR